MDSSLSQLRMFTMIWCAGCIALGVLTAFAISSTARSADALEVTASALSEAGDALDAVANVPLVGDNVERLAARVDEQADRVDGAASAVRTRIRVLAIAIGALVALLPTVPVLVLTRAIVRIANREE